MTTVAIINESTILTDAQVSAVLPALGTQVARDLAPAWMPKIQSLIGSVGGMFWDGTLNLVFVGKGASPPPGVWWQAILDNSDQADALGYHETTNEGLPIGKVFAKDAITDGVSWTVTASHELLEMLCDPSIVTVAPLPMNAALAIEVGDPVEADEFGYSIDGVLVSDFVLPGYYPPWGSSGDTKWDYMGKLTGSYPQLLPGGYQSLYTSGQGWTQTTARERTAASRWPEASLHSRRWRRLIHRSMWRKSTAHNPKPVETKGTTL